MSHNHQDVGARRSSTEGRAQARPNRIGAEALFREHAVFIATFVQRLGVKADETDDLVQEVFLVAHRKGGYEPGPAQPRSWLAAIAVRLTRAHHRALGRKRETADHDVLERAPSCQRTPDEQLEAQQSVARVQAALDQLDLEHRATFVLYELEGEPCQAIAASFGLPIGTVYSRLHYARRRFTQAYENLELSDKNRAVRALSTMEGQ